MYADDFRCYPPYFSSTTFETDGKNKNWEDFLAPYLAAPINGETVTGRRYFLCTATEYVPGLNFRPNGFYSYNPWGTARPYSTSVSLGLAVDFPGIAPPKLSYLSESQVKQPSDMIAFGDLNSAAGRISTVRSAPD